MKALALALALMVSPVMADLRVPPPGIKPVIVKMQLFCADSFEHLMNILAVDFGETVVAMGYLKEGESPTTLLIFANEKKTHSTIVITKRTKMGEQACMAWSGTSPSGMAFSVNPNPQFPPEPERKENGIEM
jgi:hypothetical protein